eukprot:CAMPEP_0170226508 /NCGR_PEP_ID=MMETSP0116_2-20130129/12965_1 /TAXON_ID=400756 /ORGANISM="Durinskia baltica, Strain CSIRO CS-38" /LENGTH=446 /DNA_ID=CAMNT_0010477233 /DNA_START=143 /DNA_END=1483 /DNA_ORIENTATION=-
MDVAQADGRRLHIRNGCERESIWIAHMAAAQVGPDDQDVEIKPGGVRKFSTPTGLASTRYWPKMGCDAKGDNCMLGDSGGPGEACVRRPPEVASDDYSRCAPPIDTKFEGTFGNPAKPCTDADAQGCDYVDMSLVDGWTLPFELKLLGSCTGIKGTQQDLVIDCRGLTLDGCPHTEHLSAASMTADLRARHPLTGQVAGCYAPCQRLIGDKWGETPMNAADPRAVQYCCPTPPETPEACRSGPILDTSFLKTVHSKCPGVYGYAYDDGMGLLRCAPSTIYELTFFCPDGKTNYQEGRKRAQAAAEAKEREASAAKKAEAAAAAQAAKAAQLHQAAEARAQKPGPSAPADETLKSKAANSGASSGNAGVGLQIEAKAESIGREVVVGGAQQKWLPLGGACMALSFVALVALLRRHRRNGVGPQIVASVDEEEELASGIRSEARLLAA